MDHEESKKNRFLALRRLAEQALSDHPMEGKRQNITEIDYLGKRASCLSGRV